MSEGTEVAVHQGGGAVGGVIDYTASRLELIKRTIAKDTTDDEFAYFIEVCKRSGLDPFSKQIYVIPRGRGDKRTITIQTGIDGFRAIATRSGKYEGQIGPQWCDVDGAWRDVWLEEHPPAAARVGVYRTGFQEPVWGVATWKSYAAYEAVWEGPSGNRVKTNKTKLSEFWERMPDGQLAKCAEVLALRKAFPVDMSGVYSHDEMGQADAHLERIVNADGEIVNDPGAGPAPAATGARRGRPPGDPPRKAPEAQRQPSETEGKLFDKGKAPSSEAQAPSASEAKPATDMARTAFAAVKAAGVTLEDMTIWCDDTETGPANGGMVARWLAKNPGKDSGDWIREVIDRFAHKADVVEGEIVGEGEAPEAQPVEPDPDEVPF